MTLDRPLSADNLLRLRSEHWPEAVTPITQLMVRVFRLSNLVLANASARVAAHGLTFTEFEALAALRGSAPSHELLPTDLYAALLISSGGLTKVLNALHERGLVARKAGDADRRSKPVRLTAKGRTIIERAMTDVLRTDAKLIAKGLSDNEVERLTRLLAKLLASMERPGQV